MPMIRLPQAARAVSAAAILVAAATGCGFNPLASDIDRFIARIQMSEVLGARPGAFVYKHTEFGQCPPHNGGPLGDLLEPSQCKSLDPDRMTTYSYFAVDAETLQSTPLELALPTDATIASDGRRVAWRDDDDDTLYVYDVASTSQTAYLDDGAPITLGSVDLIAGDDVVLNVYDDGDRYLRVYSISQNRFVAELDYYGNLIAMDGDWLAYPRPSQSEADKIAPDYVDIVLYNVSTSEARVIATDLDFVSSGPPIWVHGDDVVWTTGSLYFAAHRYNIQDDSSSTLFERDNTGYYSLDPTLVSDVGDAGLLVAQAFADDAETVEYQLVSWEGDVTTLYEFKAAAEFGPWYRENDATFVGDRVVWTDPYTGEFVVFDPATSSSERFDSYSR